MAGECTYSARDAADDTLCPRERQERFSSSSSSSSSSLPAAPSSPFFETIGGFLYRKKLEKGFVQYREVLAEDKRLHSIQAFHARTPGSLHHTLEDTYRLVAEHYWWEGIPDLKSYSQLIYTHVYYDDDLPGRHKKKDQMN